MTEDKRCLSRQGGPTTCPIVALAVRTYSAWPWGLLECKFETLPWPEWVRSLGLVDLGAVESKRKNAPFDKLPKPCCNESNAFRGNCCIV